MELVICFSIIFFFTFTSCSYNILFRRHSLIVFINSINIIVSFFLFLLELLKITNVIPSVFVVGRGYFIDLLYLLITGFMANSLLVKSYQEIDFSYNNASLLVIFGSLSIIFGQLLEVFNQMEIVNSGIILVLTIITVIYSITLISNVYFTKLVDEIIGYDCVNLFEEKEVIVVRKINICNREVTATYVANKNLDKITKTSKLQVVFWYLFAFAWFIV